MSKVGKNPVQIPAGVSATVTDNVVSVQGPKGELSQKMYPGINAQVDGEQIVLSCDNVDLWKYWGTMRSLVENMVEGVSKGYSKTLQVIGVGFSASLQDKKIIFKLGFSHPVEFILPDGIQAAIRQDPKGNALIDLTSHDKQLIGQTASRIRSLKKPEPYKGKGIRFMGEVVKLKAGKTATK